MIVNANREFIKKLSDCKNLFQVAYYCYNIKDVRVYLGRDHVIFSGTGKDLLDSYTVKKYAKCAVTYVYIDTDGARIELENRGGEMRVKDFIKMYRGWVRVKVEIYAIVSVFHEEHHVLVSEFTMDCTKVYTTKRENYLSEEVIGFEILDGKLRIMIRGCE